MLHTKFGDMTQWFLRRFLQGIFVTRPSSRKQTFVFLHKEAPHNISASQTKWFGKGSLKLLTTYDRRMPDQAYTRSSPLAQDN